LNIIVIPAKAGIQRAVPVIPARYRSSPRGIGHPRAVPVIPAQYRSSPRGTRHPRAVPVIPAQAGIQAWMAGNIIYTANWIPACAGMTDLIDSLDF
jgi:hypothetical protein